MQKGTFPWMRKCFRQPGKFERPGCLIRPMPDPTADYGP